MIEPETYKIEVNIEEGWIATKRFLLSLSPTLSEFEDGDVIDIFDNVDDNPFALPVATVDTYADAVRWAFSALLAWENGALGSLLGHEV